MDTKTEETKLVGSGAGSALVAQLVKLAHREHYNCDEDTWYGCPLSSSGCSNGAIPHECNCGADAHNAAVNAIAMKLGLSPNTSIALSATHEKS